MRNVVLVLLVLILGGYMQLTSDAFVVTTSDLALMSDRSYEDAKRRFCPAEFQKVTAAQIIELLHSQGEVLGYLAEELSGPHAKATLSREAESIISKLSVECEKAPVKALPKKLLSKKVQVQSAPQLPSDSIEEAMLDLTPTFDIPQFERIEQSSFDSDKPYLGGLVAAEEE